MREEAPGSFLSGHCGKARCGRGLTWRAAGRQDGRQPAASRAGPAPARRRGTMIHFILLFSRQGKLRLQKWYTTLPEKEKKKIVREIVQIVLSRNQKTSSFVDWKDLKLVYKRYASLYFCCAIEDQDNELLTLEVVHRYVELLDRYFGNVCELDIIFNFEKAYFILDEFIIGGEVQDQDNELLTLEVVHRYVELLDRYFGNVCELDIIFNFEKAYFILDEFIIGGEVQDTSKRSAVKAMEDSDMLQETVEEYMNKPAF